MSKERQSDRHPRPAKYQTRAVEYTEAHQVPPLQQAKLPSSKHFVQRRFRIQASLQNVLQTQEEAVRAFFRAFPFISPANQLRVKFFIDCVPDKAFRASLREYVQFALRFAVRFTLGPKSTVFGVESVRLSGSKFWGKVVNGVLTPGAATESGPPDFADFQHPNLRLPAEAEALFQSGKAKWFVVDDWMGDSFLAYIEEVAYDSASIVFVVHYSRHGQPFLFCLIGEDVNNNDWRKAGRIKAAFQREQYDTATRGRTPNLEKRSKEYQALQSHEPMKSIAADIAGHSAAELGQSATEKHVNSESRQLRRRKSELKKQD